MKPTVYIETTIPSYYFSRRVNIGLDIERTREWWDATPIAFVRGSTMSDEADEIEVIHRVRRELSARFGHDLHRYVEFLQEQERRHPERMASPETIARLLSKPIVQPTSDEDAA